MPCTQHNEKHGVWWWHHHRKMYYILINCRCARASCVMPMARQCLRWQYLKLVKQNRWQQYSMYRCHIPCYRCIRSCSQCASTGIIVIINGANTPAERQKKTSLPTGREITRRHLNVQMANVIAHGGQDSFIASHCFEHIQCDCLFSTYIHFPAVMPAAIVNIARALQTRDGHSWLLNNEILWRIYGIRSQFVRAILAQFAFFRIAALTLFVCHATTATSKKQTLCLNLCYFRWIILTFPRVNIRLFCIQRMSVSGTEPSTSQLMLYSMSDANCFGFDVIFMDVGLTVEYNNTIMNILIEVKGTHIREQKYLLEIIYLIKRFFLQIFLAIRW